MLSIPSASSVYFRVAFIWWFYGFGVATGIINKVCFFLSLNNNVGSIVFDFVFISYDSSIVIHHNWIRQIFIVTFLS